MMRWICTATLLAILLAPMAFAQDTAQSATPFQFKSAIPPQQADIDQRIMVARQLIRQENYEGAAALLEVVYESAPDNTVVTNLLKSCYNQIKQYGKAETLLRRLIQSSPDNFILRVELAEAIANQGAADSARVAYRDAVNFIKDKETLKYLTVVRSELSHNLQDDALNLIMSIRKDLKDSTLFALERGSVLESQRKYGDALKEYLPILARDTTPEAMEVERRLELLLEYPESSPEVERLLVAESSQRHNRMTVSLLADYYIKANRLDQALTYAIRRDSLDNSQGASLVYLMRQCFDRKLYNETVKMGDYVLPRQKSGSGQFEASMLYGRALAALGKIDRAKAIFDTVFSTSPRPADKGEALFATGTMYFDNVGDYAVALKYFDSVASKYPFGTAYMSALRARPFCYVRQGNVAGAREAFTQLQSFQGSEEMAEETEYYLGLLDFFENKYDSAETAFRRLMVNHPTGFYVNDALQLVMVLSEAKGSPDLLGDYAKALWHLERKQLDSARIWLDRISKLPDNSLADDALYKLTLVSLQMNDSTGATQSIERLDKEFPDSYYRPYGLKLKADMLAINRANIEQAKKIYKELLEQFPNYPFASEVRKKLRQLDTDFKVG